MGWNGVVPAELEFAAAQQLLGRHGGDALFEQPIGAWFTAAERESFQGDSLRSLGNLLLSSFSDASASVGNDDASIAILISVIQRACGDLARSVPAAEPDPVEEPSRQPSVRGSGARSKFALRAAEHHAVRQDPLPWIPAGLWAGWCWTVNVNRLDHFPLGFFARSLRNLPPRMWNVPVGVYSRRSLRQLLDVNGVGEGTLVPVVKIIADLARTLDCVPTESQARLLIMPAAVLQATAWLRRRFPPGRAPRATAIATGLIRPLLAQLDLDLGPEFSEMAERRIGLDGDPQTAAEVAEAFAVSDSLVWQKVKRAVPVFQVRWPEGKYAVEHFYHSLLEEKGVEEQSALVWRTIEILFDPIG